MGEQELNLVKAYVENKLAAKLKIKSFELEEVNENTNVNFVFRLRTGGKTYYIKHAKDFVKKIPSFKFPVGRQLSECNALKLFKKYVGDRVPDVIDYDGKQNVLTISDVAHGELLMNLFRRNVFYPKAFGDLAASIAKIHSATFNKDIQLHSKEIESLLKDRLFLYRFAGALALAKDEITGVLNSATKQDQCIVWGDPVAKNIFITEDKAYFFDFEPAMNFEPAYDVGYAAAELVINAYSAPKNKEMVLACLKEFVRKYSSTLEQKSALKSIMRRAVPYMGAMMLHRTYGEKVTNANVLEFPDDVRKKLIDVAVMALKSDCVGPVEAYAELF